MIVRQAAHVLDLLEFFARVKKPSNLAAISAALGWPRSSTFNLLSTLAQRGFLYEPRPRKGFYPSPRWMSLLQGIADRALVPEGVCKAAEDIARATGETVAVAAPAGINAVLLYVVESPAVIRFTAEVGHQLPIHLASSGRALLAQYSPRERASVLKKVKFDKSHGSLQNAEQVEAEIKRAVTRGWHHNIDIDVPNQDQTGVSLPVGLPDRRLSIVIAGPTSRMRHRIPQIATTAKRALRRRLHTSRAPETD